jgi:hypothetical protein
MPYLTFTDYSALESYGKSIEDKLEQKDSEILNLNSRIEALKDKQTERDEGIEMLAKLVMDMGEELVNDYKSGSSERWVSKGFGKRWIAVIDKMRWPLREISEDARKRST